MAEKVCEGRGRQLNDEATVHFENATKAFLSLRETAAAAANCLLRQEVLPLLDEYQERKRSAALLDFDDLLRSALKMLKEHDPVRNALRDRYRHVLVDEYQDTDLVQTEIVTLLTFDEDQIAPIPGRFSWSAIPSRRFIGFEVQTSTPIF